MFVAATKAESDIGRIWAAVAAGHSVDEKEASSHGKRGTGQSTDETSNAINLVDAVLVEGRRR